MLNFKANNLDELQEEINLRSHEVSIAIITGICQALEAGVDHVEVGSIAGGGMSIGVSRPDFASAIKTNMHRCQEAEEYELCGRATEWLKRITNE